MAKKVYTRQDILEELWVLRGKRTMTAFATELGFSSAYLGDVFTGKRYPGKGLLKKLGFVRKPFPEPVYERVCKR